MGRPTSIAVHDINHAADLVVRAAAGFVFASIGAVALYFLASGLQAWHEMRGWEAVPAELLSAGVEQRYVVASYRYRYQSRDYTGARVAAGTLVDELGFYDGRLYRELAMALDHARPITAFVDPRNPRNATLDRDPRTWVMLLELVLVLAFGGGGVGLLSSTRQRGKRHAEERTLERRFPDQPWRWRPEWTDGRIPSDRMSARATAAVLIPSVVIMAAAFVSYPQAAKGDAALLAIVLPMFIVGAGLALWAVRAWLTSRRFKETSLILQRSPVALGGRLRGEIRVSASVPVDREFKLRLSCVERYQLRRSNERVLWQTESIVPKHVCQLTPTFASIPVDVPTAAGQPATSGRRDHPARTLWRLDVAGACSGPDFWAAFEVPVFDRGPRHDLADPAPNTASSSAQQSPDARNLGELGISFEPLPGGGTWILRGRPTALAAWATVGTVLWTALTAGLLFAGASVIGLAIFGVVAAIGIHWTVDLWHAEHRITLDPGNLTLVRRGYRTAQAVVIPRAEVGAFRAELTTRLGSRQFYYDLCVESGVRRYTAARMLERSIAARLADELTNALRATP